jgi:hypothetical protein
MKTNIILLFGLLAVIASPQRVLAQQDVPRTPSLPHLTVSVSLEPQELNYVINPTHRHWSAIRIGRALESFAFDERLFSAG